jgi:DNA ligase-1
MGDLKELYSEDSKGKARYWKVSTEHFKDYSVIITRKGLVGGKEVEARTIIKAGKNIGRANETSIKEQADFEAQSKWNKKKDQGYHLKGKQNQTDTILPMLALDYTKRFKDIVFPCFVQAKLDGVRGIFVNGKIFSRMGKMFNCLEHITNELTNVPYNLDGELYSDTLNFQEIVGIVRKQTLTASDKIKIKQIYFLVYDVVDNADYSIRLHDILEKKVFTKTFKYTKLHSTEICNTPEEVYTFHDKFVSKGYEGLILRNFKGKYVVKNRSKNLQKLKAFMDEEFEITGFTDGVGVETGLVIWICKTKDDKTFNVRPKGTHAERSKLFKKAKDYIGKKLTVKFFEYTNDGIPRFPVGSLEASGIAIRDYE